MSLCLSWLFRQKEDKREKSAGRGVCCKIKHNGLWDFFQDAFKTFKFLADFSLKGGN